MAKIDQEKQRENEKRLDWLMSSENKFEFCVVCLKLLPYLKNLDVEFRHSYTPSGDVCTECRKDW